MWLNFLFLPVTLSRTRSHMNFFIYHKIYNENPLYIINIIIYYTDDYFVYFCRTILKNNGMEKRKIIIKDSGILASEVILTALQEYALLCDDIGNSRRASVVREIIDSIDFC